MRAWFEQLIVLILLYREAMSYEMERSSLLA
jgi:hypothetical protein